MANATRTIAAPSARTTRLELHHTRQVYVAGGVPKPLLTKKNQNQHPEWRLDEEEEVDWSKFYGTVLDASYRVLPGLRPIATAPTFEHLTVVCLKETGLVDIELLRWCSKLVHLDLSSNEIVHLVDGTFWACFSDLLVLLLHGNKIMEWQAIGGLGKVPRLTYLTLFFNPVCKRKMYRTFTTNCCESLRGLDMHAVSDEEVVEGSRYFRASRYRTCSSALALPQPLFKGLTEVDLGLSRHECAKPGTSYLRSTDCPNLVDGHLENLMNRDARVLASARRRVGLLQQFHARNSPVIIGQRQIRRFVKDRIVVAAAVRIQACMRKWMVGLNAILALKDVLRQAGELYLVREMVTPMQLRTLIWFQRRIAGRCRAKVVQTCSQTLERFISKVVKRFSAFTACLDRAQVGGVVVSSDGVGELATAVARALMITSPGMSWEEASGKTMAMVVTVPNCRLLRPFSYVIVRDWPVLDGDVFTDGVFVTRSSTDNGPFAGLPDACSSLREETEYDPLSPFSGLRESRVDLRVRRRPGIFGSPRIRKCLVSRRGVPVRRFYPNAVAQSGRTSTARTNSNEQLWVFRPAEIRMLARVLWTLRNGSAGKHPVPYILERHMLRCSAVTRIQAAWRGHVLRWNLLETLASCLIVARAGVCIQRWWRNLTGLTARLRLCRRLWALASAISSPILYVELDVFFALTRGWQWASDIGNVAFTFQRGDRVAIVNAFFDRPFDTEAIDSGKETIEGAICGATAGGGKMRGALELPMFARRGLVPHVSPCDVQHGLILRQVGVLLTKGVQVKKVVWPITTATTGASDVPKNNAQPDSNRAKSMDSASTDIWASGTTNNTSGDPCSGIFENNNYAPTEPELPVDLGKGHGEIEMLELTFSSLQEARARAVLLLLATEEPGVLPNRPVAQLMTLGMLRRAAAGDTGHASPTVKKPVQGYERGDAVEVSLLRLSEGHGGTWFPGVVDRRADKNTTGKVILENGWVERNVPDCCLRPYDRTGKEHALVEMSHLPSRWQRNRRSLLTPSDRLEFELLRRSLPPTTSAEQLLGGAIQLLRDKTPSGALSSTLLLSEGTSCGDGIAISELNRFKGLDGHEFDTKLRPRSPGSPVGRDRERMAPPPPRWAGSQAVTTARRAGVPAAGTLDKAAKTATAADEAVAASTWVPGNRFRRDLEKLVRLAACASRNAAEEKRLSARRNIVLRTRKAEHAEPTPRDRLERLKAAEIAIFRGECAERNSRAALEKITDKAERATNAADAREYVRDGKRLAKSYMEAKLAKQGADTKQREDEVEDERRQKQENRQADLQLAKARAAQRRADRAKQALCRAESNTFTASASLLARHVGKHATTAFKAQNVGGLRQWVNKQKTHKEQVQLRLLRRVQELQEQKRNNANRQRKALAARSRARTIMDEAVLCHRVGQLVPSGDKLENEVMHVLRPTSRPDGQQRAPGSSNHDCSSPDGGPLHAGCEENANIRHPGQNIGGLGSARAAQQRPASTGIVVEQRRQASPRLVTSGDANGRMAAASVKGVVPRPHSHPQSNHCLKANEVGKTVVVLASVPTVTAETRARLSQGAAGALAGSKSNHSTLSLEHGVRHRGSRTERPVLPEQAQLPWPLGRRCW